MKHLRQIASREKKKVGGRTPEKVKANSSLGKKRRLPSGEGAESHTKARTQGIHEEREGEKEEQGAESLLIHKSDREK